MIAPASRSPIAPHRLPLVPLVAAVLAAGCAPQVRGAHGVGVGGGAVIETVAEGVPGPVAATSFREARASGQARITFFYVPAAGFAHRDAAGRQTGVTAELLRDFAAYVAETHGIRVEARWTEVERWADFYRHVRDSHGGAFGVGNVTITEARRAELDFSPPYMHNVAVLVTHERVPELPAMASIAETFRGLTALSFPGTLHEARLRAIAARHLPALPVREVGSNDELIALLASEGTYFGYLDGYNFWRARQAGEPLRHHPVGDDASESFGVILPRGSDWTSVMEAFFAADGGYLRGARFRGHLRRHLGAELAEMLER